MLEPTYFLEPGDAKSFLAWLTGHLQDDHITQQQSDTAWFFSDIVPGREIGGWLYDKSLYMCWEGDDRLLEVIVFPDNTISYFARVGDRIEMPPDSRGEQVTVALYKYLSNLALNIFTSPKGFV